MAKSILHRGEVTKKKLLSNQPALIKTPKLQLWSQQEAFNSALICSSKIVKPAPKVQPKEIAALISHRSVGSNSCGLISSPFLAFIEFCRLVNWLSVRKPCAFKSYTIS